MITLEDETDFAHFPKLELAPWYAIRTKSNCERMAALSLKNKGYEQYLPLYRRPVTQTEAPLFPGYVFCRLDLSIPFRIVTTPGVVAIVGFGSDPTPISDAEIETVQTVLRSGLPATPCPFLLEGQRILVVCGPLSGLEGILLKKKNKVRMLVSVTMLQRSISVEIDREYITSI
jgi:transcription termination/antitermination protein NusG